MSENNAGSREAALAAARQALLRKRIQGVSVAAAAPRGIPRRPDPERAPLSFAQQRLWFIDQLSPGNPSYNIPFPVRLQGRLDTAALERALAEVIRRQEALRTVIGTDEAGNPVQRILPAPDFRLPVVDVDGEAEMQRRVGTEARRPFDLAAGPLFRAELLRLSDEDHVLSLAIHHVIGDGFSTHLLVREIHALYDAFSRGLASPLPELRAQYGDFAVWQRNRLQGAAFEKQVAFWTEKLRGAPPLLEIPADHTRPALHGHRGGTVPVALPAEATERLRALAREEGTTIFTVLLAGLAAHLGRFARQEDVVVGIPVDSRGLPELEQIVGIFLNTLPLRTSLEGDPSFREVVRRVRGETAGAYAHQDVQFEKLVDELKIERSLAYPPVFQVMFTFNEGREGGGAPREEAVAFHPMHADTGTVSFDLGLAASAHADGLTGAWSYSAELFDAETAARMGRAFEELLARVAAEPDLPVAALAVLADADRPRVLGEWNATERAYPLAPVHRLFEEQADRTPDAAAVEYEGATLTYAGLDHRASRLAHRLRALGVGPETRVGICLERSPEMVVAVLGVLKAGGAYVPLDPAYPVERLAYVLGDSGATVLVATAATAAILPEVDATVLRLDTEREEIEQASTERLETVVSADALAYVIYTSGSTGKPKGVLVEHRSLANLLLGVRERFGFGPGDVVPSLASYAFDIWGFEVFAPLVSGGTVRLFPAERITEVERLVAGMADATVLHAVPALMRQIAAAAADGALPELRRVFTGGDRVPPDLLAELGRVFPDASAHVLYGPTETTVLASAFGVPADGSADGHPIGTPLPNARAYVCDRRLDPVLVGVPGELCIGGAGVARGYLGRPELTAEKFVPDPFPGEAGARLYRTGDLARWRPDGTLEFIGRVDTQVKVRGFRIEPGEVEAALLRVDGVADAVVTAREDLPGDRRLVAYVVPERDAAGNTAQLRAALQAELPEHMIPSAFVVMEAIPLTPNGKVDTRALPAPDAALAAREYVAPRSALEQVLAGIWAEVLGAERVGIHDHFFDLGGHSLLATQVATRAKVLKTPVPVRMIFQHPTVEELARAIVAAEARPGQTEKVAALILRVQSLSPEARRQMLESRPATGA